jgi:cyclic dehypoxanthinyl futalosine synthase
MIDPILAKSLNGERISSKEALVLLQSSDWTKIVAAGHQKRLQMRDPNTVTYTAFHIFNYTNFCNVDCSFCSFKRDVEEGRGYVLSLKDIREKAEKAQQKRVNQIFLQGGVHPDLPLSYYTDVLQLLTQEFGMAVRGFSPVELLRLAEKEAISVRELLLVLKEAGLSSVPGAGAEVLTERMRQILSPKKLSAKDWCYVMGEAHKCNLPGSCNIVFGSVETPEDVIEHLTYLRDQQDETGGFESFIPWTFQPQTKNFTVRHVPGWEYLRMVALSRLFFDNIPNIEVSVLVLGKSLAEMGLHAGANDMSSVVFEENVLKSSGIKTIEGAQRFIQNAGYIPLRRTMNYETAPELHPTKTVF